MGKGRKMKKNRMGKEDETGKRTKREREGKGKIKLEGKYTGEIQSKVSIRNKRKNKIFLGVVGVSKG
jgi:hypothetical protein